MFVCVLENVLFYRIPRVFVNRQAGDISSVVYMSEQRVLRTFDVRAVGSGNVSRDPANVAFCTTNSG